jgi:hypothetical protein
MARIDTKVSVAHFWPRLGLLVAALALAACNEPDQVTSTIPPEGSLQLERMEVSPASAELSATAPGNTVALKIAAWSDRGVRVSSSLGAATYVSSAPAIASVDASGVVTAHMTGTADITVAFTLGRVTRTAVSTVTVLESGPLAELGGIYDLTALFTSWDPVWGIEDGTRHVAVLTIHPTGGGSQITGTFSDFRVISPSEEDLTGESGSVSGSFNAQGRIMLELTFEGSQSSYWYGEGTLTPDDIEGRFGAGGHISGSFTAIRR